MAKKDWRSSDVINYWIYFFHRYKPRHSFRIRFWKKKNYLTNYYPCSSFSDVFACKYKLENKQQKIMCVHAYLLRWKNAKNGDKECTIAFWMEYNKGHYAVTNIILMNNKKLVLFTEDLSRYNMSPCRVTLEMESTRTDFISISFLLYII